MALIGWYVVVQLLSVLASPIAFVCFWRCRDRGWAYTKIIGPMLPLYGAWLLAHAQLPYGAPLLWYCTVLVGIVAGGLYWRHHQEIVSWLRGEWRRIVVLEGVFLAALTVFGTIRAYNPEIESRFRGYGSEKLMDIMFVNSVHQSPTFPPHDAWFAGETINYYWYGYYVCSALCKLSGVPTHIGYNLALVTAFAQAAVATFALVWHLSGRWWAGAMGAVGLTLLGNPHSFRLYVGWGIAKLDAAPYLWDCSRVINPPGHTINEFPYFSFLWGDLHGHVTSLPFTVLVLACAACLWIERARLANLGELLFVPLVTAVAYGSAVACNNWDLPAYALILLLTSLVFLPTSLDLRSLLRWAGSAALQRGLVVAFGLVLFLPFFLHFDAPKKELNWTITQKSPLIEFLSMHGYFAFLVATWLGWVVVRVVQRDRGWVWPVLALCVIAAIPGGMALAGWHATRYDVAPTPLAWKNAYVLTGLLVGAILLALREALRLIFPGFLESRTRPLEPVIEAAPGGLAAQRFVAITVLIALCILLGTEYVAVSDFYGKDNERMNTLFKFHFEVWTVLSIAGGWIVALILNGRWPRLHAFVSQTWSRLATCVAASLVQLAMVGFLVLVVRLGAASQRVVWPYVAGALLFMILCAIRAVLDAQVLSRPTDRVLVNQFKCLWAAPWVALLLFCSTFTVRATAIKTDRQDASVRGRLAPTFDGRAWLAKENPEDLELIRWLQQNAVSTDPAREVPVLLEAISHESYDYFSRISAFTGFPAVIGWPNHEGIWRSHVPAVTERHQEGRKIFTTRKIGDACRAMERYNVDYLILGRLERKEFSGKLLDEKFVRNMKQVYATGESRILRGWNASCDELDRVRLEGLEDRRSVDPPVNPLVPSLIATLGGVQGDGTGLFNEPRGVAVGPDGRVYVADSKNKRIQVFLPDGQFERVIPRSDETNPRASLSDAYSGVGDVAVGSQGQVYVADTWGKSTTDGWGRLVAYDSEGRFLWEASSGLFGPRGVAVAPSGDIYVTNTGGKTIHVYTSAGQFKTEIGRGGEAKGEFDEPVGIAVGRDRIYVCDTGNSRVQILSLSGQPLVEFAPYGWDGDKVGLEPHIEVDGEGRIYLSDRPKGRVEVFSPDGDPVIAYFSGLSNPTGLGVSGSTAAVAETNAHRVKVFRVELPSP